jgi:hypothetical protein
MPEAGLDISAGKTFAGAVTLNKSRAAAVALFLVMAVTGVILLGLFLSILKLNNGTFIYTMDDPYIALALSGQIRHGNYGINAGVHAAPDSSILDPFLLAPASGTPIHPYLPLILNCLALFAAMTIIWRLFAHLRLAEDTFWIRDIYLTPPGTTGCGLTRVSNGAGPVCTAC